MWLITSSDKNTKESIKKDFSFKSSSVSVQVRRNTETKALNARNAKKKNAYTLHAHTLVTTNSKKIESGDGA